MILRNQSRSQPIRWLVVIGLLLTNVGRGGTPKVSFTLSSETTEVFDYVEVVAKVQSPDVANPFVDATLTGSFGKAGTAVQTPVDGFCDSEDGGVFRIRFMPLVPGEYSFSVVYREGASETRFTGKFRGQPSQRKGPVRVDSAYPWHFVWEGAGEHYFFNGTTAFWLMGWRDERVIRTSIERLHGLKVNRVRVLLDGAANILWGEPVMTDENFSITVPALESQGITEFRQTRN